MKHGFTLIELLVVVLIIGILAAVALPQYNKAVERSKASQALTLLKSVYQAAESYYLENGTWPTSFSELPVTPSWTGTTAWNTDSGVTDTISNSDWSLNLYTQSDSCGVQIGKLTGQYAGGGFSIWFSRNSSSPLPTQTILCSERIANGLIFSGEPGDYCKKVMKGDEITNQSVNVRYYKLP